MRATCLHLRTKKMSKKKLDALSSTYFIPLLLLTARQHSHRLLPISTSSINTMVTTNTTNATTFPSQQTAEPPSRAVLRRARRVCVKAGTTVVANEDGRPSLTRLGAITEQIAELVEAGVQVIFVSSGAVGMGKRLLRKQSKMLMSFKDMHNDEKGGDEGLVTLSPAAGRGVYANTAFNTTPSRNSSFLSLLNAYERPQTLEQKKKHYDSACAAAGQFEMMNLYKSLFAQCDIAASQILVTQTDFIDSNRLQNLHYAWVQRSRNASD